MSRISLKGGQRLREEGCSEQGKPELEGTALPVSVEPTQHLAVALALCRSEPSVPSTPSSTLAALTHSFLRRAPLLTALVYSFLGRHTHKAPCTPAAPGGPSHLPLQDLGLPCSTGFVNLACNYVIFPTEL